MISILAGVQPESMKVQVNGLVRAVYSHSVIVFDRCGG